MRCKFFSIILFQKQVMFLFFKRKEERESVWLESGFENLENEKEVFRKDELGFRI